MIIVQLPFFLLYKKQNQVKLTLRNTKSLNSDWFFGGVQKNTALTNNPFPSLNDNMLTVSQQYQP